MTQFALVPLSYLHMISGDEEKAYLEDLAKARLDG